MSFILTPEIRYMICEEIISRVFISSFTNKNFGTGFSLPIDGLTHYITSARLFKESSQEGEKKFFRKTEQLSYYDVYTDCFLDESLDLAIVKTNLPANSEEENIIGSSENTTLGQDVFLLGFPYLNRIRYPDQAANNGYPLPIIKKTTLSLIQPPTLLFDAQANSGFSGGPVVYWDYVEKRQKICGVVASNYMKPEVDVSSQSDYGKESGFGVAYDISVIRKIMDSAKGKKSKTESLRLL